MFSRTSRVVSAVLLFVVLPANASKKFLGFDDSKPHRSLINNNEFKNEVIDAIGCGGNASEAERATIQSVVEPMWRTLPKTDGRIDRRSLRYLVHRYFMQTSSLMIRGFEPTRSVNESHWGVADVLSQMVPAYVESVLESNHAKKHGFNLKDAINMVVVIDQLVFEAESSLLEKMYRIKGQSTRGSISHDVLQEMLEMYLVEWMVAGDEEDMEALHNNRSLVEEVVPHFQRLVEFINGRVRAFHFARVQQIPRGHARDTWHMTYTFDDAHVIVGGITRNFQSFWQSECETMKTSLMKLDSHNTGRVPLSKFYNSAINTDWRFGESEAYLRELGALDESSSQTGAQVIIPNYVQATSNCIVSTPHYLVCCQNECEAILGDIEVALKSPTALPSDILPVVGNMTLQTTIDDEEAPELAGALTEQLEQIANVHGGVVPLHGRLFAQWLHYAFPTSCPFPHKIGMVSAVTPLQYGDQYEATDSEKRKHAANASAASIPITVGKEELQWMSQWSDDEEFIVDYSSELGMSYENRLLLGISGLMLLMFGITGGVISYGGKSMTATKKCWV